MGCASSKKVLRTRSFQQNLQRPFPRVAAIPIIEDFLFANNHEQFVAMICKKNNFTMQISSAATQETSPSFISKDNEVLQSGSFPREEESEKHKPQEEESEECKPTEEESEKLKPKEEKSKECKATDEESEECNVTEEESEECKFTEENKPEVIKTWELMEGLEDGETDHTSEKFVDNGDKTRVTRTGRRSKSMENFHTLEEYDMILAGSKTSLWDRNSKRYLYYLGSKALENVTEFTLRSVIRTDSLPPKPSNTTPILIDWKEESKDNHICALESSVLQAASELRDTGNEIISQENSSITEVVPENISRQENNHFVEATGRNIYSADINLEIDHSTKKNSSKRSLHERVKLNDIGGISITSTPNFPAVGSLRDWLNSGGHLYSPGVTTTSFGNYIHGDQWSSTNTTGNSEQFRIGEVESEMHSFSALEMDKKATIIRDSSVSSCSSSSVSAIEKENRDTPLFDPELLASFEKALEQLSNEEKCVLRLIDDSSHFLSEDCHPEDSENGLHDSSRMEDISI
ncbi:uncharacterized protein LOC131026776 isoform X2 [Cryptomeria japonica]|uniref:uncharacterized protein LOC131026776 isoform X2 n=1 Tax=Cryptomeria japonica TaxID=3369 RepID=UPI0025ACB4D0|nr:uncharacterized protein LOC131026776 isoform X2 [Cryptomeria japonica]